LSAGPLPENERRAIVRDGLAVGVATGAYGVSFGAVSVAAGLDVWQTCALSLLVFTGASQFAFVGVLASGGTTPAAVGTAWLLGVRNGLYGLRLTSLLSWGGLRRVGAAHLVIDESTAMAVNRDSTAAARLGFLTTGLAVFVLWNLATLGGAVTGRLLGDPRTYGLDAAVGGAFLALLWPRLSTRLARVVAVLAAAVALGLVPLTAPGIPVLAAGSVALLGLLVRSDGPSRPVPVEEGRA
jgi:predicted branched-subunit amino acid permease